MPAATAKDAFGYLAGPGNPPAEHGHPGAFSFIEIEGGGSSQNRRPSCLSLLPGTHFPRSPFLPLNAQTLAQGPADGYGVFTYPPANRRTLPPSQLRRTLFWTAAGWGAIKATVPGYISRLLFPKADRSERRRKMRGLRRSILIGVIISVATAALCLLLSLQGKP